MRREAHGTKSTEMLTPAKASNQLEAEFCADKGHEWLAERRSGSVTATMIAGNFFTIAEEILGVSRATEMVSGSFLSPYILIGGVSVTGAL